MSVQQGFDVRGSGTEKADLVGVGAFAVMVAAVDGWLISLVWAGYQRASESGWDAGHVHAQALLSAVVLAALVLSGAALGAWAAGRRTTRQRRWRYAAAGALAMHAVLPVVLAAEFAQLAAA